MKLLLILFLVLLNGFFVAAEFAIIKVRSTQIETLIRKKHRRARWVDKVIHQLDVYLSATQLGITFASLGLGWLGEPYVAYLMEPLFYRLGIQTQAVITSLAFGVAFGIITFLHIVLGELAPKSLAIRRAQTTALWVAFPLFLFYRIFYPAIWLLNSSANLILRSIGIELANKQELVHSEEELRLLLSESSALRPMGAISQNILSNAFSLKTLKARNIMLPRNKIVPLHEELSLEENLAIARKTRHSRFPVCRESIDQVVGMVHVKDLLWLIHSTGKKEIKNIRREILFTPEFVNLETLLSTFLEKKCHMAIIVDEFGGTLGMVTLEDVLEELVGEIQDEFDQEQPLIRKLNDKEFIVDGGTPLHDVEEEFGVHFIEDNDATTLGGYLINRWGDIPPEGTKWSYENLNFVVQKVERLRISQILVQILDRDKAVSG